MDGIWPGKSVGLLGAIRDSPGLKLNSPGRRTCQLDRPANLKEIFDNLLVLKSDDII